MEKRSLIALALVATLLLTNVSWAVSYQGLDNDASQLQGLANDKETELSTLSNQILLLQAQESSLTAQYHALQSSYFDLSNTNHVLECDYENLTLQYHSLQANQTLIFQQLLALQESYNLLHGKYLALQSSFSSLEQKKDALQRQYDQLLEDYELLSVLYQELQGDLEVLQWQYQDLQASYDDIYQRLSYLDMVRLSSLDLDYYMSIREKHGGAILLQDKAEFCAHLSMHDRASYSWQTVGDMYYEHAGYYRYNAAFVTEFRILNMIGVTDADSPTVKITKILDFIHGNITYKPDIYDRYFAPTETLSSGTGDCEDFSILASSLFELAGIESAVAFFSNSEGAGHSMVLVHLPDLGGYGYYYYNDLTSFGLAPGIWIIIEPQALMAGQHRDSWFLQWNIRAAAET